MSKLSMHRDIFDIFGYLCPSRVNWLVIYPPSGLGRVWTPSPFLVSYFLPIFGDYDQMTREEHENQCE